MDDTVTHRVADIRAHVGTAEAARLLAISRSALLRAVRRGALRPSLRAPGGALLFDPEELAAYTGMRAVRSSAVAAHQTPTAATPAGATATEAALRASEHASRRSEARYQNLLESAPDAIVTIDHDGRIVLVNGQAEALFGYPRQALLGQPVELLLPDHRRAAHIQHRTTYQAAPRTRPMGSGLELAARRRDGSTVPVEISLSPVPDGDDRLVTAIVRDISARKAAEEARAWLAAIVAGSSDAIIGMALDRTILSWNAGAERLYGYSAAEAVGRSIDLLVAMHENSDEVAQIHAALMRGEAVLNLETVRRHKDGRALPVSISVSPVRDASGAIIGVAGIHRDIAARVRAEQAVAEARRLAEALDRVSLALAETLDPTRLYRIILEQAMAVLPCESALIFDYREGWAWVVACSGEPSVPPGTRLFPLSGPGRTWLATDYPDVAYLPDTDREPGWVYVPPWAGERRPRSVVGVPLRIDGAVVGTFQFQSTTPHRYTERHLMLARAFGTRIVQALRNARRYAEEQQRATAAEELAQERSDFLGAVSHELRTPLTAITGYAELLRDRWSQMDQARRAAYLDRIVLAAGRQQRLVQDLLTAARAEAAGFTIERTPFALRPVIERAIAEVQASYAGQRVDLHGPDGAGATGDVERTEQILVNLLDNAAKYSPDGTPVAVSWGLADGWVVVRVRDGGRGIPEEGRARLFTRFGRLAGSRPRGGRGGTGLGLYLSRVLARAMDGELDLESTGASGSTFRLLLPGVADD